MRTQWLAGVRDEDRENFRLEILRSKKVLDKALEIVYNMIKDREAVAFKDYDTPSWSHKQAHTNGYSEALRQVADLLTIKEAPTNG